MTALRDSTLLPLRCCDIPIDMRVPYYVLEKTDARLIQQRTEEIQAVHKMYCPECNKFIDLDFLDNIALSDDDASPSCACDCGVELCVTCRTKAHPHFTCDQNRRYKAEDLASLMALARQRGWKQCPNCSIMIEFTTGCNHMECRNCRHNFCFQCLSIWDRQNRRCSSRRCELWEEDRLLEAGEARVRALEANQGQALPVAQRRHQVQHEIDALRENEQCLHNWERRNLRGECESCGYDLWVYGMVCNRQCRSTVCYTCAHHRLPRRGWR